MTHPTPLRQWSLLAQLTLATLRAHNAVQDQAQTSALVSGQAAQEISLGSEYRRAKVAGSTLLWEKEPGKTEIIREETDQLPPVLIYGNRY